MKNIILLTALLLTGCVSIKVPVQKKFPDVPPVLMEPCPEKLREHPQSEKLSDQIRVVVENYGEYYICKEKLAEFQIWYKEQKKLYESVK